LKIDHDFILTWTSSFTDDSPAVSIDGVLGTTIGGPTILKIPKFNAPIIAIKEQNKGIEATQMNFDPSKDDFPVDVLLARPRLARSPRDADIMAGRYKDRLCDSKIVDRENRENRQKFEAAKADIRCYDMELSKVNISKPDIN
jgi:hypothetical protein